MPQVAGKQIKDGTITATQADTTNGAISTVNAGDTASEGAGSGLSRRDHQHAVSTAAAGTIACDDSAAEGSASSLARSDHVHAIVCAATGAVAIGDSAAEGSASSFARSDHVHSVAAPAAPENTDGAAASAGASADFARRDHKHDVNTAAAVGISDTDAEGSGDTLAFSDHTHKDAEQQESIDTEAITGSDTAITDTLTAAPRTGSQLRLYLNGVQQEQGASKDYTLASQTITWLASSGTAVDLEVSDVLIAIYAT